MHLNAIESLHLSYEVPLPDLFPVWTWWIFSLVISVVCPNEVQA